MEDVCIKASPKAVEFFKETDTPSVEAIGWFMPDGQVLGLLVDQKQDLDKYSGMQTHGGAASKALGKTPDNQFYEMVNERYMRETGAIRIWFNCAKSKSGVTVEVVYVNPRQMKQLLKWSKEYDDFYWEIADDSLSTYRPTAEGYTFTDFRQAIVKNNRLVEE